MTLRVALVNSGLSNLNSITRAVEACGGTPFATDDPASLAETDRIILPGVGAFATAMEILHRKGLVEAIRREVIERSVPLLGVCLGMQLLAESSTEGGLTEGLNLIPGKVMPLDGAGHERVPHIGWNSLNITKNSPLLEGITEGDDFYFVHGYHLTAPEEVIVARTPYCGSTVAVVQKAHVYATQFHPEKSQKVGFTILRNFLSHTC